MKELVGEPLRAAREARGWSVDEVASQLRVSPRYVVAMEEGETDVLPEAAFVRGYVRAYARLLSLDADALLAALAPVEVKAPRQLIGPDGQAGSSRSKASVRAPSFRSNSRRHHWVLGGLLALVGMGWMAWPDHMSLRDVMPTVADTPAVAAGNALPGQPVTTTAPLAEGGVMLEVPLPAPSQESKEQPAAEPAANATVVPATAPAATGKVPAVAASPAPAVTTAPPAPAPVPRKGLHMRFTGTCWVEVRDADNVVVYTRIAMPGSEVSLDGKLPLTVTLGDAAVASVWYNGDRVVSDRFSSTGIARLIVGQATR